MKKAIISFFIVCFLLLPVYATEVSDIKEKIDDVVTYAQNFENREINYLQLRVYTSYLREVINRMLGGKSMEMEIENKTHEGLKMDEVKVIFGEPTEYTRWVWAENIEEVMKLDDFIPRWEKTVYEGSEIKITFNAWPHITIFEDEIITYYWIDFEIFLKRTNIIDASSIISEINNSIASYYNGNVAVIDDIVSNTQVLRNYMEENKEDCRDLMVSWLGEDSFEGEEKMVMWNAVIYSGPVMELISEVHSCADCEWPWVWANLRPEMNRPMFFPPENKIMNREIYKGMELDDLKQELADLFQQAVQLAPIIESIGDPGQLFEISEKIGIVNEAMNEKLYGMVERERRQERYETRMQELENILDNYANKIKKEERKTARYQKTLWLNETLRQDRWCNHVNDVQCDPGYGCFDADCVSVLGGNEDCSDRLDNDNDGKIDCEDLDCREDNTCLCRDMRCDEQPNRECNIITSDAGSEADLEEMKAINTGSKIYVMLKTSQKPVPSKVIYGVHLWNGADQRSYSFNYHNGQVNIWSENGEVQSTSVDIKISSVIEFEIPLSLVGYSNNFWIGSWVNSIETWTNLDDFERGLNLEKISDKTITVDGIGTDWSDITGIVDLTSDVKTKGAQCHCVEGYYDCDGNWENGCEANSECDWMTVQGCGPNQEFVDEECKCFDGWFDCDNNGDCESEGGCQDEVNVNQTTYVCGGIDSLVPCDQKDTICGTNSHESEGLCYCDEGFYDCDNNGDCLETRGCNVIIEDCSNGYDDDDDNFVDCEDIKDCPDGVTCPDGFCSSGVCEPLYIEEEVPQEPEKPQEEDSNTNTTTPLTGYIVKKAFFSSGCNSDADCGPHQGCDVMNGNCWCQPEWFDCDDDSNNGCESNDITCNGRVDPCADLECKTNQRCSTRWRGCECEEGYHDCDGDWNNGCESTTQCTPCQTDADCAQSRCAEWGDSIQEFGCYAGSSWVEERGRITVHGSCEKTASGQVQGWVDLNAWGSYNTLMEQIRLQTEGGGKEWCSRELNESIRLRELLVDSLDAEFLDWFFNEYVNQDPNKWHLHIGGIWDIYWRLVNNIERTVQSMQCLGMEEFPDEFKPIRINYSGDFGDIEIWEEWVETDFFSRMGKEGMKTSDAAGITEGPIETMSVLTPYMKAWIFPPKEIFKQEMSKGKPEDEKEGPSKEEVGEMKNNTIVMGVINQLSSMFGGSADFLLQIVDGEEVLFEAMITMNPEIIMHIEMDDITRTPDLTMKASFDWFYNMIMTQEKEFKGERIESPHWARVEEGFDFGDIGVMNDMFNQLIYAIRTGEIQVDPPAYLGLLIMSLQGMGQLIGSAMM